MMSPDLPSASATENTTARQNHKIAQQSELWRQTRTIRLLGRDLWSPAKTGPGRPDITAPAPQTNWASQLPTLALVARNCHPAPGRTWFIPQLLIQEGGLLLERLRGLSERHPPRWLVLWASPRCLSLRHLSRKLTKSIQSRAISDLWKRRAELGDTLRQSVDPQSTRRCAGPAGELPWPWRVAPLLARQVGDHPPGSCLQTWTQSNDWDSLPQERDSSAAAPRRGASDASTSSIPTAGMLRVALKGLHTRRHDRIQRDLIAKLARQAGLTATTEQAMLIPDQIQEDGQPAPGSVQTHPIVLTLKCTLLSRRAPSSGWTLKIHTVNIDLDVRQGTSPRRNGEMQGIRPAQWLQPTGSWQRDDACGYLNNLAERPPGPKPSSTESLTTGFNSLSDKAPPTPLQSGPLAPSCGVPSLAPCLQEMQAQECAPPSRPGRPRRHTRQLAELPRGDSVSAWAHEWLVSLPERSDAYCAQSGVSTTKWCDDILPPPCDILWQFSTSFVRLT